MILFLGNAGFAGISFPGTGHNYQYFNSLMNLQSKPQFTLDQARKQLGDSSRALSLLTASMVYEEPSLFSVFIDLALEDEKYYAERASRVICVCSLNFPELFKPHCSRVISALKNLTSEGAMRNFLKALAEVPLKLTKKDKSILLNQCFDYLVSNSYPIAVQVFSMQILYNLSHEIPEIGEELYRILEEKMSDASAGYKSRAKRIMMQMKKSRLQVTGNR
jgi:hypothetical protein